jgi:hypothetical protein
MIEAQLASGLWKPVCLRGSLVEWRRLPDPIPYDPFFETTLEICMRRPATALFPMHTELEALACLGEQPWEPAGLIFHISFCGSTLLSQMLATQRPRYEVLSEPGIIAAFLARSQGADPQWRARHLRGLMRALAGPASTAFFKLNTEANDEMELFELAFPNCPQLFLYRHPVEVMVSNQRGFPEAGDQPHEQYLSSLLSRWLRIALERPNLLLLNHSQLAAPGLDLMLKHFRQEVSAETYGEMLAASKFHAKAPTNQFHPDSSKKQAQATPEILDVYPRQLEPLYLQLESLRQARTHTALSPNVHRRSLETVSDLSSKKGAP